MTKYKLNKGFISQKIEGKITIFDPDTSALYTFNETASFIFEKMKLGWNKTKIATALAKKYSIKVNQARKDVEECIKEMEKLFLIASNQMGKKSE